MCLRSAASSWERRDFRVEGGRAAIETPAASRPALSWSAKPRAKRICERYRLFRLGLVFGFLLRFLVFALLGLRFALVRLLRLLRLLLRLFLLLLGEDVDVFDLGGFQDLV